MTNGLRSMRRFIPRWGTAVALLAGSLVMVSGSLGSATPTGAVTPKVACTFNLADDVYNGTEGVTFTSSPASVLDNDQLCGEIGGPQVTSQPSDGTVVMSSDGTFTYTPTTDFIGDDSFTYDFVNTEVRPAASEVATVSIVLASSCQQDLVDDSYSTTQDERLTVIGPGVLSNDTLCEGQGDVLSHANGPSHGTLEDFDDADGGFQYVPDPGFVGTDSFEYSLDDFGGAVPFVFRDVATVTIDVMPECSINLANDSYSTTENGVLTVSAPGVIGNDTLCGQEGSLFAEESPTHGTLTNFNDGDGGFTYTPDPGFSGTDSFQYVFDEDSIRRPDDTQREATVTIDVVGTTTGSTIYVPATSTSTTSTTAPPDSETTVLPPLTTSTTTTTTPDLTTVTPPPTTAVAVSGINGTTGTTPLARTGTDLDPVVFAGLGLIALGGLLAAESNRRRKVKA